ncbi:MAG: EamA family transporter [Deltaproteobacteria bacterium]
MITFIALGSAFAIAIVTVFLKKLFEQASARELAPLSFLQITLTLAPFSFFFFKLQLSTYTLLLITAICIIDSLSNYYYFKGIELNEVSYFSIFMSLSPIFTLILVSIFIDYVSIKTIFAIICIIISIYLMNLKNSKNLFEPFCALTINHSYYGLSYALLTGVSAVLFKLLFSINTTNPPTIFMIRCAFVFCISVILLKPRWSLITKSVLLQSWLRALFVIANFLLYLYAIMYGNVVIAITLVNTYPIFVIIFSHMLFKEKITARKLAAIFSVLFFIFILSYTS